MRQRAWSKELIEAKNLVTMAYTTMERAAQAQDKPNQFERQTAIVALMALADDLCDSIMEVIAANDVRNSDGDVAGDVG
jgi:hypothetical protein